MKEKGTSDMRKMNRRDFLKIGGVGLIGTSLLGSAACGGGQAQQGNGGGSETGGKSGSVTALTNWSDGSKKSWQAVLRWCHQNHGTQVTNQQTSSMGTVLATRVQGGKAPDVAFVPSPTMVEQYATGNALQPLDFFDEDQLQKKFTETWLGLGTINNKLYGLPMKASNKSLVWYSPKRFQEAGYKVPKSYDELVQLSEQMVKDGKTPWAVGAKDSWTLTDFLENVYLSSAGPDMYDKWVAHEISWTDPSVKNAFEEMNRIMARDEFIAGSRSQALGQDLLDAVTNVFQKNPTAEMYQEADFVAPGIEDQFPNLKPGEDFDYFPFPPIGNSQKAASVVVGGDLGIVFNDTPGARKLMKCLADPDSLSVWAKRGGYTSPNTSVPVDAYPQFLQSSVKTVYKAAGAGEIRFDGSDQLPPKLGGDYLPQALQEWFRNPRDYERVLKNIEQKAGRYYSE